MITNKHIKRSEKGYGFPIPPSVYKIKGLRSVQPEAIAYLAWRVGVKPEWVVKTCDMMINLRISRRKSDRVCKALCKKGYLIHLGKTRVDIPEEHQRHGITHQFFNSYSVNLQAVASVRKEMDTMLDAPMVKTYSPHQVRHLFEQFLSSKSLNRQWSSKRDGWVIDCPGQECHTHDNRRDDCVLYPKDKGNGFLYINAKCRHSSCMDERRDLCLELNKEWGAYLDRIIIS